MEQNRNMEREIFVISSDNAKCTTNNGKCNKQNSDIRELCPFPCYSEATLPNILSD